MHSRKVKEDIENERDRQDKNFYRNIEILEKRIIGKYFYREFPYPIKFDIIDLDLSPSSEDVILTTFYTRFASCGFKTINVGPRKDFLKLNSSNVTQVDRVTEMLIKDILFECWEMQNKKAKKK